MTTVKSIAALVLASSCVAGSLCRAADAPDDRTAAILTPPPPATPRINGPHIYGERTGKPFFYAIPVTGDRPIKFAAYGLPDGLTLDEKTGFIAGKSSAAGHHKVKLTATNAKGSNSIVLDVVIGEQICLTPPLGWNSWNKFFMGIDDAKVRASADAMISSGLINHGWTYINVDDSWEKKPGSEDPRLSGPPRDDQGRILTNKKFPDMKALSDYIHGRGLKFGLYSSPGPLTCARYEGSFQHEDQDAQSYADWGVDYLKYDWCSYDNIGPKRMAAFYAQALPDQADEINSIFPEMERLRQINKRTAEDDAKYADLKNKLKAINAKLGDAKAKQITALVCQEPYRLFRKSLDKVDRDIVFSFCEYGRGNVWEWGTDAGGNTWRTTNDIQPNWGSMSGIGFGQNGHEAYSGPGHWNDPDMLEIGNGKLAPDEMYTHITLWCLLDSPLLIGCDMTKMDAFVTSLFTNDEVLAVNQDSLGKQAYRVKQDGQKEIWMKPLADGTVAVGLFNRGPEAADVAVRWSDLKLAGAQAVRDLWRQKDIGTQDSGWTTSVNSHGAVLIRIGTPVPQ